MQSHDYKSLQTFSAVCADQGKDESALDVTKGTSNEDKALICLRRCVLIAKAINGPKKIELRNTQQNKWSIWVWVNPEDITDDNPAGFRLSFGDCLFDASYALLGVRPYFIDEARAKFGFENFKEEWEQLMRYQALWLLE